MLLFLVLAVNSDHFPIWIFYACETGWKIAYSQFAHQKAAFESVSINFLRNMSITTPQDAHSAAGSWMAHSFTSYITFTKYCHSKNGKQTTCGTRPTNKTILLDWKEYKLDPWMYLFAQVLLWGCILFICFLRRRLSGCWLYWGIKYYLEAHTEWLLAVTEAFNTIWRHILSEWLLAVTEALNTTWRHILSGC